MNIKEKIVIFSVFQSHLPYINNIANTSTVESEMKRLGIPYKRVLGSYNGVIETSLVIPAEFKWAAYDFARLFSQDSILETDSNGNAYLTFIKTNETNLLGQLRPASEEYAVSKDAYTFDPETATYWIAE